MTAVPTRTTLASSVSMSGIGLHTGIPATVWLKPGDPGAGIRIGPPNQEPIHATLQRVVSTRLATTIGTDQWTISTVEHMLSAILGAGIDDINVIVEGPEIPAVDGSAEPWLKTLQQAGLRPTDTRRQAMLITQPIEIQHGARYARLLPPISEHPNGLSIHMDIDFAHPAVGVQPLAINITPETYASEIAWARTFAFEQDVEALQRMGLALGGSLQNAVVFGKESALNPEGLRATDEPVRHKALDLLGDLALVGHPIHGHLQAHRPGHGLTHTLTQALRKATDCWRLI